jgi:hypothetical protein
VPVMQVLAWLFHIRNSRSDLDTSLTPQLLIFPAPKCKFMQDLSRLSKSILQENISLRIVK